MEFTKSQLCNFCLQKSAYVCPRCGINYCSLICYRDKKHELCTEAFYKDCCIESLKGVYAMNTEKEKMVEILKRESEAVNNLDAVDTTILNKPCKVYDEFTQSDDSCDSDNDLERRLVFDFITLFMLTNN